MPDQVQSIEMFVLELTRHQTRLRGLIRCLLHDPKLVEDVVQDTNVVLLRKSEEFVPGSDFWAWASTVAKFQILTHAKKLTRDRLIFDEAAIEAIVTDVATINDSFASRQEALSKCLESLPQPQRQLLEMRYSLDHPIHHIAATLGRPEGSIRQTLLRIRQALLVCIESRIAGAGP